MTIVGAARLALLLLAKDRSLLFVLVRCPASALGLLKLCLSCRHDCVLELIHAFRIFTVFLLDGIFGAGHEYRDYLSGGRRNDRLLHVRQVV